MRSHRNNIQEFLAGLRRRFFSSISAMAGGQRSIIIAHTSAEGRDSDWIRWDFFGRSPIMENPPPKITACNISWKDGIQRFFFSLHAFDSPRLEKCIAKF